MEETKLLSNINCESSTRLFESADWIIWHLSDHCNLDCSYCFTSSSPSVQQSLSSDILARVAGKINESKATLVTLIGGEPLSVRSLPEIVSTLLKVQNRRVTIDSNGTYLPSRWSDVYLDVERFNITLDDLDADIHNELRGGYLGALNGIRWLAQKKVPFSGNITITNRNLKNIFNTACFLVEEGAAVVGFNKVKSLGRAEKIFSQIHLSSEDEQYVTEEIIRFSCQYGSRVIINISGFFSQELFEAGLIKDLPSCMCGDYKIAVDARGKVWPCESMPFFKTTDFEDLIGFSSPNLLDHSIAECMESQLFVKWRSILRDRPPECTDCRYRLYCHAGCRALNVINTSDLTSKPTDCNISQTLLA
jgi:radical SAM protein with 4Fe4S-binding SPASM domain